MKSGGQAVTLDDILASLFPDGHDVKNDHGILLGSASCDRAATALVVGVADRTALGVDEAIRLSRTCWTPSSKEAGRSSSSWTATASA